MATSSSPDPVTLTVDRDTDFDIEVTLPAGAYLSGGASGWVLSYVCVNPNTGATIISKTTAGGGIAVTTSGSTSAAALFTISIVDTDVPVSSIDLHIIHQGVFKRTDDGNEVDIAAPCLKFRR